MPLFLLGNFTPTIPHQLRQHRRGKFPHGLADAANASGKKGSNEYQVNQWLWQFAKLGSKPCLGGLPVAATEEPRTAVVMGPAPGQHCKEGSGPWQRSSKASKAAEASGME